MKQILIVTFILLTVAAHAQSVDPLTGRLQMSVPMGALQASGISVPVEIYHQGDALQVSQGEGACGLGWNLNINGFSVSRLVRGLPDDYNVTNDNRKGWSIGTNALAIQNFVPQGNDDLSVCTDEQNDWNFLQGRGYEFDTEPDIFFFSGPGLSGQFVLGTDGNPKLLTHQDVKITITRGAQQQILSFTIQNNQGVTYTYGVGETTKRKAIKWKSATPAYFLTEYNQYLDELSFVSRWTLNTMKSSTTGAEAGFVYSNGETSMGNRFISKIKQATSTQADTLYYVQDNVTPKLISSIQLKTFYVNITWANQLVKKVAFSESQTGDSREFELGYHSFTSTEDLYYPKLARAFLKEVKQTVNCSPRPSYIFTYGLIDYATSTVGVPWPTGWGQDYFGFYNGSNSNKNIPNGYYYASESDGRRLRTTPIPSTSATTSLAGGNRAVVEALTGYGRLTRVDLPSGGFASIEYEANKYFDATTNEELLGPGVRVKKIAMNGGEVALGKGAGANSQYRAMTREYEYKLNDVSGATSGLISYPPMFAFATGDSLLRSQSLLGEQPEVLYTRVREKIAGQGSTLYEFTVTGTYPGTGDGTWEATKTRIARNAAGGCAATGNLKTGYYLFPFAPSANNSYRQGLLSRQAEYTETGTLVREQTMTYTTLAQGPATILGLKFEKIGNTYHYGHYKMFTGKVQAISQQVAREYSEETPAEYFQTTTTYTYNSKLLVEQITTTNPDNAIRKVKMKYAGDYAFVNPPTTDTAAFAIKALNTNNRHAEVIERIERLTPPGGTETVVGAQLTVFRDYDTGNGREWPYYTKALPPGSALTESSVGGGDTFVSDADYITTGTLKDYDIPNGLLLSTSDDKRHWAATHYAVNQNTPIANFANIRAQQAVYEGFELPGSFGLAPSPTGSYTYPAGRTGNKGIQLTPAFKLVSSGLVQKGAATYRVSCWVKAAQVSTITFKAVSGGTNVTVPLSYTAGSVNNWAYLEGELTVSTLPATFSLEVYSAQTVTIDDIVFMPKHGRVSFKTVQPLTGVTSVTDDQGNSVVYTYDAKGRLTDTFDNDRNLVERKEYQLMASEGALVNANFTSSTTQYLTGQAATFTAGTNCTTITSRQWTLYDQANTVIASGSNATFAYTFASHGQYSLKHSVTSANFGTATFEETLCVYPGPFTPNVAITAGSGSTNFTYLLCLSGDASKTFSLTGVPSGSGAVVQYSWQRWSNGWTELGTGATQAFLMAASDITFRCIVTVSYPPTGGDKACIGSTTVTNTIEFTVDFQDNSPCQ